jgi:hypothetical protein
VPSDDEVGRMIRTTVETWKPRRGPDWSDFMVRVAGSAPSAWFIYTAASAALVVILVTAFLVGSALHIGALGPQQVPVHIPGH